MQLRVELLVERVGDDQRAVDAELVARPQRRGDLAPASRAATAPGGPSRRGRSPGSDRCRSRRPRRRASPAARAWRARRGSTSRPRTPRRSPCARARRGRPTRPTSPAPRGARRRARRWRTRGCPPARRRARWRRPWSRRSRRAPPRAAGRARCSLATSSREATASSCGVGEPHPHRPVEQRDRGRHGALLAHRGLDLARDPRVVRPRQAVGDDRRLERHHRAASRQRGRDLVRELDHARLRSAGGWRSRSSASVTSRTKCAGTPNTTVRAATSLVTTIPRRRLPPPRCRGPS